VQRIGSHLLVTCITPVGWWLRGVLSCARWSSCFLLPEKKTILFSSTRNFIWIPAGGWTSFAPGIVPASSLLLSGLHCQIFRCRRTWLVLSATRPSSSVPSFQVRAPLHECPGCWLTKSCLSWWSWLHFGVPSSPSEFYSDIRVKTQTLHTKGFEITVTQQVGILFNASPLKKQKN